MLSRHIALRWSAGPAPLAAIDILLRWSKRQHPLRFPDAAHITLINIRFVQILVKIICITYQIMV